MKRQTISNAGDYLLIHAPDRARELIDASTMHRIAARPGKKVGTGELILSPLPYVVVYAIRDDVMFVVLILHGAQQWP